MAENKQTEAKINKTLVLKTIRLNPGISRIRIAGELGLNRSTITHIVHELMNRNLICEMEIEQDGSPSGGRKPIGLVMDAKAGALLGLEWQIDFIRYVLLDFSGDTLLEKRVDTSISSVDALITQIRNVLQQEVQASGLEIRGIGIGIPGRVDPLIGRVLQSLPLNLYNFPLAGIISKSLGLPVLVENDANCFAWGEIQENKAAYGNFLCLMLEFHHRNDDTFADQEIGMGLVLNEQVYYGSRHSSGELSGPLVDYDRSREFLKLIEGKNSFALSGLQGAERTVLLDYLNHLFTALSPIVSILDPEKVFLGGRFNQIGPDLEAVLEEVPDFPLWSYSSRGEFEVAHGSAGHFMETMFALPQYKEGMKDANVFWDNIFP